MRSSRELPFKNSFEPEGGETKTMKKLTLITAALALLGGASIVGAVNQNAKSAKIKVHANCVVPTRMLRTSRMLQSLLQEGQRSLVIARAGGRRCCSRLCSIGAAQILGLVR